MKHFNIIIATATACAFPAQAVAQLVPPAAVQGKEYSNSGDEDSIGAVDFLQNIYWDFPGAPMDAFDYSGSGPPPVDPDQVDALANHQDLFFSDVLNGTIPIVVSFETVIPFLGDDLYYHNLAGGTGVWALGPIDINIPVPPDDVDAVELWGLPNMGEQHDLPLPPGPAFFDANNYSYIGDCILPGFPAPPGTPKISIFYYNALLHVSTLYIGHDEIRDRLVQAYFIDPALPNLDPNIQIDVDALMVYDQLGNGIWEDGDCIIFSLWPSADSVSVCGGPGGPFDGGEIWTWKRGDANGPDMLPGTPDDNPAFLPMFLVHGGRIWDTANPVGTIFGVPTENINALEAVPDQWSSFCDASDGSLAFCPCGNAGNPDSGCDIPQLTGGVRLDVIAQTTSPNRATVMGTGFSTMGSPTAIVIRSALPNLALPLVFGDGVLCLDSSGPTGLVRLGMATAIGGVSTHTFGNGAMSGAGARQYQLWFRSNPSTYCDAFAAFNLSNGRTIVW